MTYNELTETIIEIVDNPKIKHENLTLSYKLDIKEFIELEKELFYLDPRNKDKEFKTNHALEVSMDGIIVKITKK